MKKYSFSLILVVLSIACRSTGGVVGRPLHSDLDTTTVLSTVISPNGLRLRDLPDSLGSTELTIIPKGGVFEPYYCIEVRGTEWSFGVWRDPEGTNWIGYVAARYLDGGCYG